MTVCLPALFIGWLIARLATARIGLLAVCSVRKLLGRTIGLMACWLVGCLVGLVADCLAGWLGGWLVGWLLGGLAGWLADCLAV